MKQAIIAAAVVVAFQQIEAARSFAADSDQPVWRVLNEGARPNDARLGPQRGTRDVFHPWSPANSRDAWEKQSKAIRERVLVSTGLWPMPPKTPLKPVVHGKIDRGDYMIEKVYFASHPGHYVTGNLYRPTGTSGPRPGILCPHGHWSNGRFYDAGEEKAQAQIDKGAERYMSGARFPVQARMAQLARMGCVVFHYDMVGYADSKQIGHTAGFTDPQAGLRLQNFLGLQTFNSIRALDFLLSLPEVDPERIGVTGSSGGGTQTFMLCGVDSRPAAAFPAVMVSTNMQGGCICENAEYLRIGVNNIAFAALFAPKPMAMSGANDWTIDIETKGLPELKQVYSLYDKADRVAARAYPQFGHNYNCVAREMMYDWFNTYLDLGLESPIVEQDFVPVPPAELSVFDDEHRLPDDAVDAAALRDYLTEVSQRQFDDMLPDTEEKLSEYRRIVSSAARVMLDAEPPARDELTSQRMAQPFEEGLQLMKGLVQRPNSGEGFPFVALLPAAPTGRAVVWIDGRGKSHLFDETGKPTAAVRKLLDGGFLVVSADVFLTGEFVEPGQEPQYPNVDEKYQGYTFGFNRPVLSNRVRDIVAVVTGLSRIDGISGVQLVGTGDAGPWALLAAAVARKHLEQAVVDLAGFHFGKVDDTRDPMYLPGALKYGDIGGLAALAAPLKLTVAGTDGIPDSAMKPLAAAYDTSGGRLKLIAAPLNADAVSERLRD